MIMRHIRQEMRSHRWAQLTVTQFRALIFASVREGPSLSDMAEHIGLSLPAASRVADLLVRRGLLRRRQGMADRRRVALSATRLGEAMYNKAHRATRAALARRFDAISLSERLLISDAMLILRRVFAAADVPPRARKPARRGRTSGGLT